MKIIELTKPLIRLKIIFEVGLLAGFLPNKALHKILLYNTFLTFFNTTNNILIQYLNFTFLFICFFFATNFILFFAYVALFDVLKCIIFAVI